MGAIPHWRHNTHGELAMAFDKQPYSDTKILVLIITAINAHNWISITFLKQKVPVFGEI